MDVSIVVAVQFSLDLVNQVEACLHSGETKEDFLSLAVRKEIAARSRDEFSTPERVEKAFVSMLETMLAEGSYVSEKPGRSYAPTVFSAHPRNMGIRSEGYRSAMRRLLLSGEIKSEMYGPPSRRRSRLVLAK